MNANETKKTTETYEWLTATMRNGRRRIEVLSWKRLARIYDANRPGRAMAGSRLGEASRSRAAPTSSRIRKAINTEARRCGYTPRTILALNA
jgi:hypothetical protein